MCLEIFQMVLRFPSYAQYYIPYYSCSLHIGSLFVRSWSNRQYSTKSYSPERSSVRSLHVGHQLANIAVESNIFLPFKVLQDIDEATDECFEYGSNHLTFGAPAEATSEIGGVSTLSA